MGVFTLLVTALNTALLSGGLLLAPILAGLLVMATRYLSRQPRTSSVERAVCND
jgi:competence protein ComGF